VRWANPTGLAFNSAGDLFASDYTGGHIYEFAPGGVPEPSVLGLLAVGATAFLFRRSKLTS
jgi:hypothetical protein